MNNAPLSDSPLTSTRFIWLGLVAWLALCFAAAAFGAQFTPGEWYEQLAKPTWTPPGWLFGPVWTILYTLMAVAAWLVWKIKGLAAAALPLGFFIGQLCLNAAWSWLFFGLQQIGWALVDIVALLLAILATIIAFWRWRPLAAGLLIPYAVWVSFAMVLNFAIWRLNM